MASPNPTTSLAALNVASGGYLHSAMTSEKTKNKAARQFYHHLSHNSFTQQQLCSSWKGDKSTVHWHYWARNIWATKVSELRKQVGHLQRLPSRPRVFAHRIKAFETYPR